MALIVAIAFWALVIWGLISLFNEISENPAGCLAISAIVVVVSGLGFGAYWLWDNNSRQQDLRQVETRFWIVACRPDGSVGSPTNDRDDNPAFSSVDGAAAAAAAAGAAAFAAAGGASTVDIAETTAEVLCEKHRSAELAPDARTIIASFRVTNRREGLCVSNFDTSPQLEAVGPSGESRAIEVASKKFEVEGESVCYGRVGEGTEEFIITGIRNAELIRGSFKVKSLDN